MIFIVQHILGICRNSFFPKDAANSLKKCCKLKVCFLLQGLNQKQFLEMYNRAYPHAFNSNRLANSVFRLCDRNNNGIIDFTEFVASICIPPTRYVHGYVNILFRSDFLSDWNILQSINPIFKNMAVAEPQVHACLSKTTFNHIRC